ncbi:MAG: TetR/AcrR family transcriptional regulator [Sphaerochaetaceae bacterium]
MNKGRKGRPVNEPGASPTNERILEAAIRLFSQNGYDGTSMRQIATAVDLTEGAIYKHYQSKEAIMDAILAYAEKRIYSPLPIEQHLGKREGESPFRGLLLPLPGLVAKEPRMIGIMRIISSEMHHNEKLRSYYLREYVQRAETYLAKLFTRAIQEGTLRPCDPLALAKVFNAYRSEWMFNTFLVGHDTQPSLKAMEQELETSATLFEQLLHP